MLNVSVGSSGSIVNLGNPEERKLLHALFLSKCRLLERRCTCT